MGRIFISAGHGGIEQGKADTGVVAGGTTEAQQMILLRDQIVSELRSQGNEVLSVPDDLSEIGGIQWINARGRQGDIALEIHADASANPSVRGVSVFYIANNEERKKHADILLLRLLRRVPQFSNRGTKADTSTGLGQLRFCRQVIPASLLMTVGFLTSPEDRALLINKRSEIAQGIAEGLAEWSREVSGIIPPTSSPSGGDTSSPSVTYPVINITINNQNYAEKGILINGNAFIPIDLVDRLGIDLTKSTTTRLVQYQGVVYVKAVELRDYNITVVWESATRTVVLRSILRICPGLIDKIVGHGNTSEVQMIMFVKNNNEKALEQFPDLARLYREEATTEGINYDIAFSQMCIETSFLRFGGELKPSQNNFGALGSVGGGSQLATFPSARLGVRAHIQHLKAYASLEPIVQEIVDPRFRFVTRGIAPLVAQLSGRWTADLSYGEKIMAMLRRLYESANLL
jgi:hypothetical protein